MATRIDVPGPRLQRSSSDRSRARDWDTDVSEFLREKVDDNPIGEGWVKRIRWELKRFPALVSKLEPQLSVPSSAADVRAEQVLAIRRGMRWEKATFAIHFAALRQFVRWGENPIAARPSLWRLPTGQPSHRRWLTKEQLARLLHAARGKERLLVALEGLNGLRRVEVLRLRRKDVLLDESCLRVLGKGRYGGKWRKIPMHPKVRKLIPEYLRIPFEESLLFDVSASTADALLRRAAGRAGFGNEGVLVSHHDLRRTFGRVAHGAGMDLVQLKNLLGHASVEMTVHYIGIDSDQMRRGLELIEL